MKAKQKMLTVSIEYISAVECVSCLENIILQIKKSETNHQREKINCCNVDWKIQTMEEPDSYRVEEIKGKKCLVLPSKMNKKS